MGVPGTLATQESALKRLEKYIASEWQRVLAYAVTEAGALLTLAHVQATSFQHELTVAGAAALAAAVNKARAAHLIP